MDGHAARLSAREAVEAATSAGIFLLHTLGHAEEVVAEIYLYSKVERFAESKSLLYFRIWSRGKREKCQIK